MRRVHLRGHTNIRERLLIHTAGFNLGLLMRQLIGVGTPRGLKGRLIAAVTTIWALIRSLWDLATVSWPSRERVSPTERRPTANSTLVHPGLREMAFTTGCQARLPSALF
jgi:transposase